MKTILVTTDFSEASRNAGEYGAHLAKALNARILLFHSFHVPALTTGETLVFMPTMEEIRKENEEQLKKEALSLKRKYGIQVDYKTKMGLAVDEILEEEKRVLFTVMGMRDTGNLDKWILGSITTDVIRKVKNPVLILPENVKFEVPKNIVLATDYNAHAISNALNGLTNLIEIFKSKLYIVNVKLKKEEISVEKNIAEIILETKLKGIEHFYYFPEKEDVVDGINEFIKTKKAQLVAFVPHQYNFIERLFHRSVTKKMAFHTKIPLFILPDLTKSKESNGISNH
jgi:nucleotide-binding universal stress UspA family protein